MTADIRNPETLQQLSALVDGELERDQARFLIRRLPDDPELSGAWQRWHVAGECLRGHGPAAVRAEFMANISLAIADDATPGRGVSRETLKWVGGFAVAASVALAALMAVRPGVDGNAPATQPLIAVVPVATPAVEVAPSPYREQDLRPAWREESMTVANEGGAYGPGVRIDPRVESYLVRHNEATTAQGQGFVPYVTLVAPVRERAPAAASR
jgi:sigma-E factor negative regulatory protein RseA